MNRAKLIARYYWERRNKITNLFPEQPNAGDSRFDGTIFTTSVSGPYCNSLLSAYELSGEEMFLDQALTYLRAYLKYGFDRKRKKFWGALDLNGNPVKQNRIYVQNADSVEGYMAQLPSGYLLLWRPYKFGYEYPLHTAQSFVWAFRLSGDKLMLQGAVDFANWIGRSLPEEERGEECWFREYYVEYGRKGTYAENYGRAVNFLIDLFQLTAKEKYLKKARNIADQAIKKLYENGIFKGHPAKPYYEAVDGVGVLIQALLKLERN